MNLEDLTPEQMEKARACKTPEDVLALAKEEGYELSDDELEGISGGAWGDCADKCPDYVDKWKYNPCTEFTKKKILNCIPHSNA